MIRSVSRRLGVLPVALLVLGSTCTAINGIGFEECTVDQECGASRVCLQRYCLPMPAQCRRDVGAFDKPNTIRIAALLPLSEVQGDGGRELNDARELARLNAMELAFKHVNASAGINNRLFSLYVCDTRRNSDALVEQATWAVSELGVPAVITSGSGATLTASGTPALVDAGTMLMSANATSQELSGSFRGSMWRVAPPDSLQVRVMASTLVNEPDYAGAATIAVLYEETPYGRGVASLLRERLRGQGKTSEIFGFKKDPGVAITGSEVTASIERLERFHSAAALDAGVRTKVTVFVGFPSDIVPVVTAARTSSTLSYASGHRWFFSDSAKNPAIVTPLTLPQLVGAIGTTPAQGTGTAFADFRSQYVVEFGIEPSDFSFTSHSYDAAYLVMLCAAYATRDNGALTGGRMSEGMTRLSVGTGMSFQLKSTGWRDASAALAAGRSINVDGASGQLDFDLDAGAPSSPYEVWQVTDGGSFTTVRLVNP
jgi:branched-chain amino acid transport system substrate-binding protein